MGFLAGMAFTPARKLAMQGGEALAGDWMAVLKAEHRAVETLFEQALQTTEQQKVKRRMLVVKIAYALNKHAIQEENVIYPALRHIDEQAAEHLISDHGQIKTLVSRLQYDLSSDQPAWLETMRQLSEEVIRHAREEEDEIFPRLHDGGEDNASLTRRMHWEGIKVA